MKKDEVTGAAQESKGKVVKEVGKATGNNRNQAKGEADEQEGKATKTAGQLQGKADDLKRDVKAKIHDATK